jgi:hypothetical protein
MLNDCSCLLLLFTEFPRDKRIVREAQDKRIAEIVAWMQSSTGSPVPPGLMGPPTHPNQSPLMQTPVSHTCKELQH